MTNYVKNILTVFQKASQEETSHGLEWYSNAHYTCNRMAIKYDLPLRIVVGVCAALSPTNRWERNLIDTDNMLACFMEGGYVEDTSPCTVGYTTD